MRSHGLGMGHIPGCVRDVVVQVAFACSCGLTATTASTHWSSYRCMESLSSDRSALGATCGQEGKAFVARWACVADGPAHSRGMAGPPMTPEDASGKGNPYVYFDMEAAGLALGFLRLMCGTGRTGRWGGATSLSECFEAPSGVALDALAFEATCGHLRGAFPHPPRLAWVGRGRSLGGHPCGSPVAPP